MSAFFLAINRNRSDFERPRAERMFQMLARFGQDAERLIVRDHYALGYKSQWTVPEELGEQQPLETKGGRYFFFHGRVDNRDSLLAELDIALDVTLSDAVLIEHYFSKFGEARLTRIIGPFVFVVFDPSTDQLFAARDGMGGRYLVYRVTDQHILISTVEMPLVAHDSFAYRISESKATRLLMNLIEPEPSSYIESLSVLSPGVLMTIKNDDVNTKRYYRPDSKYRITLNSDADYAAEFKRLLRQAVQRRLRSVGQVGMMLSGGMDSVPISILAAQSLAEDNQSLLAFSWIYEKYPEQDERRYSSPICRKYDIEQVMILCDDISASPDGGDFDNPIVPFSSPYMGYHEKLLEGARDHKVKVMLTGLDGDLLYEGTDAIVYELLKRGELRKAVNELRALWRESSSISAFIKSYILKPLKLVQRLNELRLKHVNPFADVLHDNVASLLVTKPHWLKAESQAALRPRQWQLVFDAFSGEDTALGRYHESQFGLERRSPFRDRDLCEFMLAIPSEHLKRNSVVRPIVKEAFRSEFTPELLARNSKTSFSYAIKDAMCGDEMISAWFAREPQRWQHFVKKGYFGDETDKKHADELVRWRCGYYDYWYTMCYTPVARLLGYNDEI